MHDAWSILSSRQCLESEWKEAFTLQADVSDSISHDGMRQHLLVATGTLPSALAAHHHRLERETWCPWGTIDMGRSTRQRRSRRREMRGPSSVLVSRCFSIVRGGFT
jgi:hypothetical protein